MRIVNKKHRASVLGLMKFAAALAIIYYHTIDPAQHWSMLYLLVEFFFFVTGYYTYKHFQSKQHDIQTDTVEEKSSKAIRYSFEKIYSLAPYIVVAIVLQYFALLLPAVNKGASEIFNAIKGLPFDALLLGSQAGVIDWPMWFLSALAIVLPLYCLICQNKYRRTQFIVVSLICVIYYFNFFNRPNGDIVRYVGALGRAFVDLLMGSVIYVISEYVKAAKTDSIKNGLLQIAEIAALALFIVCMYPSRLSQNVSVYQSLALIALSFCLVLFMSGKTIMAKISSPTADFLEKTSMVIFMVHGPIVMILDFYHRKSALLAMGISFIVSIILLMVITSLKKQLYHKTASRAAFS